MSPNIGASFWARACWLCPLLCPLCSARLPGHWAWHIRTAALLVPSFIRTITESKPAETKLSRDWALLGLTGPRSDQASGIGSSSSLTSTCYDLWTDSKTAPDLIWADSPPWKLPLVWLLLPGTKRAGSGCTQAGESSSKGNVRGGKELIAMLQVQMAHCFMCGLNGLCQPSYWRHIIWRYHKKTLSTKIQRFISKGHFHESKPLLDGRDSWSHHEDKSKLNVEAVNEERIFHFTTQQKVYTVNYIAFTQDFVVSFICMRFKQVTLNIAFQVICFTQSLSSQQHLGVCKPSEKKKYKIKWFLLFDYFRSSY